MIIEMRIPYWPFSSFDDPDYCSEPYGDDDETHYIMLDEGVNIITDEEGEDE